MNQGERDEILFKLSTAYASPTQIRNPGMNPGRFSQLPDPLACNALNDQQLTALANSMNLGKAPAGAKADCEILYNGNWVGVSLKSTRGAGATILNHTHRDGIMAVANRIVYDMTVLDNCVQQYHSLRTRGVIGEDVSNTDPNSPFAGSATDLIRLVNYFLMVGTPRGDSKNPAALVGVIQNPLLGLNGVQLFNGENYIQNNWQNIRFSMRNKNPSNAPLSQPWNVSHNGSVRGELHIRMV